MSEGGYFAYITSEGNLMYTYENKDNIDIKVKTPGVIFTPDDSEEIIRGLIYQSAKHLGRTSVKTLINMLEYRFSEQYNTDMDK